MKTQSDQDITGGKAIEDLLCAQGFFADLPRPLCRSLARQGRICRLGRGETLFHEGFEGTDIFFLVEGRIQLSKETLDGNPAAVHAVRPGEVFGEVVLFEQRHYPVTAEAIEPAMVIALPCSSILSRMEDPAFRDEFLAMLMRRLRQMASRIRSIMAHDVEERFCLFLYRQYGRLPEIEVAVSHQDMARAIGAAPETFSRMLRRLKADGLLQWDENRLRLDPRFWQRHDLLLEEAEL